MKKSYLQRPPDSYWVGNTPVLQYLLRCELVEEKDRGISDYDIYTKEQVFEGIRKMQVREHLQAFLSC